MKTTKMTRIDTLKARIAALQEELKVLEVATFKVPVRCTIATVNAALEAGGKATRIDKDHRGFYSYSNGRSDFARFRTAKEAFENVTGIALQKYRAGLPG